MIDILHTALAFIVAISVLVAVHEYGHFQVARLCGVRVLVFSIGFGQTLFRWHDKRGTEYIIAAIPLGGYVKMVDEREEPVPEHWLPEAFNRKPVSQRFAIVAAGPLANFLLAWLAYTAINLGGVDGLSPVIGKIKPGSVAAVAGLEPGQEIVAVDGEPTPMRHDVSRALVNRLGETGEIRIAVKYPDASFVYETVVDVEGWLKHEEEPNPVAGLGIEFYYPPAPPIIREVVKDSVAEQAGMQPGDRMVSIDGQPVPEMMDAINYIRVRAGQPIEIVLERKTDRIHYTVKPEATVLESGEAIGRIGVAFESARWPDDMIRHHRYGLLDATTQAGRQVVDMSVLFWVSIKKLILGEISHKNISGPLTIATLADESAKVGLVAFVELLAILSISLAVMNLLPIPVLDGGHLLYYAIEAIIGRPVPLYVQEWGFKLGLFLIISLMVLALYNDFMRVDAIRSFLGI